MQAPAIAEDEDPWFGVWGGSELAAPEVDVGPSTIHASGGIKMNYWGMRRYYYPYPSDPVRDTTNSNILGYEVYETVVMDGKPHMLFTLFRDSGFTVALPPASFSWPLRIDGRDEGKWLGAGPVGTGVPVATDIYGWAGICTSAFEECSPVSHGGIAETVATWIPSYEELGLHPGSVVELGSANGGRPASFVWPITPLQTGEGALAVAPPLSGFKTQGEIRLGLAPAGTPADEVDYPTIAELGPISFTGEASWSGELTRPAASGDYELHVRTCWGRLEVPECDHVSAPLSL
jgi:hypothetical protein